jgi:DNA-binding XRE family transcriptional regulator
MILNRMIWNTICSHNSIQQGSIAGMHAHRATPEVILGQEIARLRRQVGLSQEELGFRTEVHRTYISQLERGLKSPALSVILKLSCALKALASKLAATVERKL